MKTRRTLEREELKRNGAKRGKVHCRETTREP